MAATMSEELRRARYPHHNANAFMEGQRLQEWLDERTAEIGKGESPMVLITFGRGRHVDITIEGMSVFNSEADEYDDLTFDYMKMTYVRHIAGLAALVNA